MAQQRVKKVRIRTDRPSLIAPDSSAEYVNAPEANIIRQGQDVVFGESGSMGRSANRLDTSSLNASTNLSNKPKAIGVRFKSSELSPRLKDAPELMPGRFKKVMPDTNIALRTGLATLQTQTFNPQEFANILQNVEPRIQIESGPEGGLYVTHPDIGETFVINKPGISPNDGIQILSAIAAASPAGFGKTVTSRAIREAFIQSAIETSQKMAGGEINPEEIAMASGFSVLSDVPGMISRGRQFRTVAQEAEKRGAGEAVPEMTVIAKDARMGAPIEESAESLTSVVMPSQPKVRAVEELGLQEVAPLRIISDNPQYRSVEQALATIPGSQLMNAEKEFINQLSAKTGQFIDEFGGTRSIVEANESVKTAIEQNLKNSRAEARKLYDKLSDSVNPRTKVKEELRELSSNLVGLARDAGGISNLSSIEQSILKEVRAAIGTTQEPGRGMTYGRLDDLRKEIGEKLEKSSFMNVDTASFRLDRLYDSLTAAQDTVLKSMDPELSGVWQTAKKLVSQRKDLEKVIASVAGKNLQREIIPQLSTAIKNLAEGKSTRFIEILDAIPKELRQEAMITAMGSVFTRGSRNATDLVPAAYASWWQKVKRDSGARRLLYKNLPKGSVRFLNNLATVSQSVADSVGSAPRTGIINAMEKMNSDGGFIDKVLGMIPMAGGGLQSLLKVKEKDALDAGADLLGDPGFKRIISRAAANQPTDKAEEAFKKTKVYINWINSVPANIKRRASLIGLADFLFEDEGEE